MMWIEQMYNRVAEGDRDGAVDLMFDNVDDLLLAGKMSECDAVLQTIDLGRLESYTMVGLLSITLAAKAHLPHRAALVQAIEQYFERTDRKNVGALMDGLR